MLEGLEKDGGFLITLGQVSQTGSFFSSNYVIKRAQAGETGERLQHQIWGLAERDESF